MTTATTSTHGAIAVTKAATMMTITIGKKREQIYEIFKSIKRLGLHFNSHAFGWSHGAGQRPGG